MWGALSAEMPAPEKTTRRLACAMRSAARRISSSDTGSCCAPLASSSFCIFFATLAFFGAKMQKRRPTSTESWQTSTVPSTQPEPFCCHDLGEPWESSGRWSVGMRKRVGTPLPRTSAHSVPFHFCCATYQVKLQVWLAAVGYTVQDTAGKGG